MTFVRQVSASFPGLETEAALAAHRRTVLAFVQHREAVCAKVNDTVVGVLLFSKPNNTLCFLAVNPTFRRQHMARNLICFALPHMTPDKAITVATYCKGTADGAAARAFYQKSGFVPSQLTIEFGAPVQEFVRPADKWSALGE